jgi:hypothetical protein
MELTALERWSSASLLYSGTTSNNLPLRYSYVARCTGDFLYSMKKTVFSPNISVKKLRYTLQNEGQQQLIKHASIPQELKNLRVRRS